MKYKKISPRQGIVKKNYTRKTCICFNNVCGRKQKRTNIN